MSDGKYDDMSDDEAWDAILRDMAQERGITPAEMETRLREAARMWSDSLPWWTRAWLNMQEWLDAWRIVRREAARDRADGYGRHDDDGRSGRSGL